MPPENYGRSYGKKKTPPRSVKAKSTFSQRLISLRQNDLLILAEATGDTHTKLMPNKGSKENLAVRITANMRLKGYDVH